MAKINNTAAYFFDANKSNNTIVVNNSNNAFIHAHDEKPSQYQIGIDTFARAEANMNFEEIMACCRFNIDKYTWRKKGQDAEDFQKIIAYAEFAMKQLMK